MNARVIFRFGAVAALCGSLVSCGYIAAANRSAARYFNQIRSFETEAERQAYFESLRELHREDAADEVAGDKAR